MEMKYVLEACLGQGGFGKVYRALDVTTGSLVAIKRVFFNHIHPDDAHTIIMEINLLKFLNHENIVKYLGFHTGAGFMDIMLELYCENGSLDKMSKRFGTLPESLVAIYMQQGSNILSTKVGTVKLADFGVATNILEVNESTVVGTPYWMAPEIIQLIGASTASDIWSAGCTVVELLTGNPPYFELTSLSALFKIVNDDHPPIPEHVSKAAFDFLLQCFQKDPNLRLSADKLLKHPWLQESQRVPDNHPFPRPPPVQFYSSRCLTSKVSLEHQFAAPNTKNLSRFEEDDAAAYELVFDELDDNSFQKKATELEDTSAFFEDSVAYFFDPTISRFPPYDDGSNHRNYVAPTKNIMSNSRNSALLNRRDYRGLIKLLRSTFDQDILLDGLQQINLMLDCNQDRKLVCLLAALPVLSLFAEKLLRSGLVDLFLAGGGMRILGRFLSSYSVARNPLSRIAFSCFLILSTSQEVEVKRDIEEYVLALFRFKTTCANILHLLFLGNASEHNQLLCFLEVLVSRPTIAKQFGDNNSLMTGIILQADCGRFLPAPVLLLSINVVSYRDKLRILKLLKRTSVGLKTLEPSGNNSSVTVLTGILATNLQQGSCTEFLNQSLNLLYNFCDLSRFRQTEAAKAGVVPILQKVVGKGLPSRQFAIPIFCNMSQSGERTKSEVWGSGGIDTLSILLLDRYWQVTCIGIFSKWLREDREATEPRLLLSTFVLHLQTAVLQTTAQEYRAIVQPLKELVTVSKVIGFRFFSDIVLLKIIELTHKQEPIFRVPSLKLLKLAGEVRAWRFSKPVQLDLSALLQSTSSENHGVIVRNLAVQICDLLVL